MIKQFESYGEGINLLRDNGFFIKNGQVFDGGNVINHGPRLPLGIYSEAGMLDINTVWTHEIKAPILRLREACFEYDRNLLGLPERRLAITVPACLTLPREPSGTAYQI
jgi:hypothetical protein